MVYKMDGLIREWIEDIFGTNPRKEDLIVARNAIDELIAEIDDDVNK